MGRDYDRNRQRGGGRRPRGGQSPTAGEAYFDPQQPRTRLVDELAEKQADALQDITSSQLRRFFGEVKELYRRLTTNQDYRTRIEPQFKMLRSKAYYATRSGGGQQRISGEFCKFVENAVQKVQSEEDFRKFVEHFEAVVGFLYGKSLVRG